MKSKNYVVLAVVIIGSMVIGAALSQLVTSADAQQKPDVPKWEYKIMEKSSIFGELLIHERELNSLGKEGWELIETLWFSKKRTDGNIYLSTHSIFRRRIF